MPKKKMFENLNSKQIRNKFDERKGFLQPIYADVFKIRTDDEVDKIDAMRDLTNKIIEGAVFCGKSYNFFFTNNSMKIVGYFAAIQDIEKHWHVGASFTDPSDFKKFDRETAQTIAIYRAMNILDHQNWESTCPRDICFTYYFGKHVCNIMNNQKDKLIIFPKVREIHPKTVNVYSFMNSGNFNCQMELFMRRLAGVVRKQKMTETESQKNG